MLGRRLRASSPFLSEEADTYRVILRLVNKPVQVIFHEQRPWLEKHFQSCDIQNNLLTKHSPYTKRHLFMAKIMNQLRRKTHSSHLRPRKALFIY